MPKLSLKSCISLKDIRVYLMVAARNYPILGENKWVLKVANSSGGKSYWSPSPHHDSRWGHRWRSASCRVARLQIGKPHIRRCSNEHSPFAKPNTHHKPAGCRWCRSSRWAGRPCSWPECSAVSSSSPPVCQSCGQWRGRTRRSPRRSPTAPTLKTC